jgi:hypothetical protein
MIMTIPASGKNNRGLRAAKTAIATKATVSHGDIPDQAAGRVDVGNAIHSTARTIPTRIRLPAHGF